MIKVTNVSVQQHKIVVTYQNISVDIQELEQESIFGLMTAIEYFDPERGKKFSIYASFWIRHLITRYLESCGRMIRLPSYVSDAVVKMKKYTNEYALENDKELPSEEYLAGRMGMPVEKVRDLLVRIKRSKTLSTNLMLNNGFMFDEDGTEIGDTLASDENVEEMILEQTCEKEVLERAQAILPGREWDILRFRFGLDGQRVLTLEEIGDVYGVTREWVRQLEMKALQKLRRDKVIRAYA